MPDRIGPYQLFEKLGVGGMGTAYRAEDTRTGAIVALKLLHPHLAEDTDAVARMQREARIAGGLHHPNIARVLDSGQEDEHYYIAIEYVDGETLQQRLRTIGRMSEQETQRIALGITQALEAAHAANVIHRDIKPSNILLSKTGGVVVTDFSVARALGYTTVTQVGAFVGTPAYAAPEAVDGKPDIRADLYSLGIVMYQLLTGRVPFAADSPSAALRQQQTRLADMRPLRAAAPSLAPIVAQLMEKDPKRRPQTPAAAAAALVAVGDLPTVMMDDATLLKTFVAGSGTTIANRTLSTWHRLPLRARIGGAGAIVTGLAAAGIVTAALALGGPGDDPLVGIGGTQTPTRTVTVTRTAKVTPLVTGTVEVGKTPVATGASLAANTTPGGGIDPTAIVRVTHVAGTAAIPPTATNTPATTPYLTPTQSTPTPPLATIVPPTQSPETPVVPKPAAIAIVTSRDWRAFFHADTHPNYGAGNLGAEISGGAQTVCLRTTCGADTEWGYMGLGSWDAIPGAEYIWRDGVGPLSAADGRNYYFYYEFDFLGDIRNDYNTTMTFAFDDGMRLYVDGNEVLWPDIDDVPSGTKLVKSGFSDKFNAGTRHVLKLWGVNGGCACTYGENPAGVALRIDIAPK